MLRLLAATAAALLLAPLAGRAQDPKAAQAPAPAPAATAPATPAAPAPGAAGAPVTGNAELDARIQAAIQKAVDKAKEDVRNEVKAELEGAKAGADFMGAVQGGPKLEFLELDGYFRTRGQLFNGLDLGRGADSAGYFVFPVPISKQATGKSGTLASANMRLRLEPTLNISDNVRVRMQVDVLDNYVLGSSQSSLMDAPGSPYPVPFFGSSRNYTANDPTRDRPLITPKRVWGEVQTPVGLLSFGRMPSHWGLGMMANAGRGVDADYGDTVDRLQFALPQYESPIGKLTFVPMLDFDAEGALNADPVHGPGYGQPFDADQHDDARTYGIKIVRLDSDDELRRTLEQGHSSVNFGLYYNYRTQAYVYPAWMENGFGGTYGPTDSLKRGAYAHIGDLWGRYQTQRFRLELEVAGVYGVIGDPRSVATDVKPKKIDIGQWGGVLQAELKVIPNKFTLTGELGMASGDSAPGFGNNPLRYHAPETDGAAPYVPNYGSMEGPQWGYGCGVTGMHCDHNINNFRFNPAYTVDMILFRRILGGVTDAWYLKPALRWDIFPGLTYDAAAIYSQAMFSQSTPSSSSQDDAPNSPIKGKGHSALGVELDQRVTLNTTDGFTAWGELGVLQPLAGFGDGTSRGWVMNFGFATKF